MIEWLQQGWGYALAASAGLAALISLFKNIGEIKKKLNEPNEKQDKRISDLEETITHTVTIDKFDVLVVGMACLLRDGINNHFAEANKNGYISARELEVIESMFESYTALGGNGVIKHEMDIIRQLPIK